MTNIKINLILKLLGCGLYSLSKKYEIVLYLFWIDCGKWGEAIPHC